MQENLLPKILIQLPVYHAGVVYHRLVQDENLLMATLSPRTAFSNTSRNSRSFILHLPAVSATALPPSISEHRLVPQGSEASPLLPSVRIPAPAIKTRPPDMFLEGTGKPPPEHPIENQIPEPQSFRKNGLFGFAIGLPGRLACVQTLGNSRS